MQPKLVQRGVGVGLISLGSGEEGTPIELFLAGVAENAGTLAHAVATGLELLPANRECADSPVRMSVLVLLAMMDWAGQIPDAMPPPHRNDLG